MQPKIHTDIYKFYNYIYIYIIYNINAKFKRYLY